MRERGRDKYFFSGYRAPLTLYTAINSQYVLSFTGYTREINVCIGKEWHRFPTTYFLPDRIIQPLRSRYIMYGVT